MSDDDTRALICAPHSDLLTPDIVLENGFDGRMVLLAGGKWDAVVAEIRKLRAELATHSESK